MVRARSVRRVTRQSSGSVAGFTEREFARLPEPVGRYFAAAVAPGVAVDSAVRLDVHGRVRVRRRRWVPFRACYELTHQLELFGYGSAATTVLAWTERYADGVHEQRARWAGVVPKVDRPGRRVVPAAAERVALAALMLPTALLPRWGVEWAAADDSLLRARLRVHGTPIELRLSIDPDGQPLAASLERSSAPMGARDSGGRTTEVITRLAYADGFTVPGGGIVGRDLDTDGLQPRGTALRRAPAGTC